MTTKQMLCPEGHKIYCGLAYLSGRLVVICDKCDKPCWGDQCKEAEGAGK